MPFFIEYAKDSRFLIKILTVIICVETIVIGYLSVRQDIAYINPSNVIGTVRIGYVPEESVAYFGVAFVSFLGNVNPYSALEQYKSAYNLMCPKLQSAMKKTLEDEGAEITRSNISIQTIPIKYDVREDREGYILSIEATRISWVYGQETKKNRVLYTLACQKASTSKVNPFGLEVCSYDYKNLSDSISPGAGTQQ